MTTEPTFEDKRARYDAEMAARDRLIREKAGQEYKGIVDAARAYVGGGNDVERAERGMRLGGTALRVMEMCIQEDRFSEQAFSEAKELFGDDEQMRGVVLAAGKFVSKVLADSRLCASYNAELPTASGYITAAIQDAVKQ